MKFILKRHSTKLLLGAFYFVLFVSVACTEAVPDITSFDSAVLPESPTSPVHSILIAQNAMATKITNPSLNLESTGATEMFITNTPGCIDPVWIPYATEVTSWGLETSQLNSTATVYAMFKSIDKDSGEEKLTDCLSDTIVHDDQSPTVSLSTLPDNPMMTDPVPISVSFSEDVTDFTASDINIGGGMGVIENFTGSGANYSFDLKLTYNGVYTVDLVADKAVDTAGNSNTASNTININFQGGAVVLISDFEADFGDWTNVAYDSSVDWTLRGGSTPSTNTGPSSANEGTQYIYTEASSNYNKTFVIESVDLLAGVQQLGISFDYHMYGSDMGTLSLEISTDGGGTWVAGPLWSKSGDQGNGWLSDNVNICILGYQTGTVRLRFVGVTGPGFGSDMALDNVQIRGDYGCEETPDTMVLTEVINSNFNQEHTQQITITGLVGSVEAQITGPSAANALVRNVTTGSSFVASGLTVSNNDVLEVKAKAADFFAEDHEMTFEVGSGVAQWNISTPYLPEFSNVKNHLVSTQYSDSITVLGPTVPLSVSVSGDSDVQIRNKTTLSTWGSSASISTGQELEIRMTSPANLVEDYSATVSLSDSGSNNINRDWHIDTTLGLLKVWGGNERNFQKNIDHEYPNANTRVIGGINFTKVYNGRSHSCGISTTGAAYCWGHNFYGQLGNGNNSTQNSPALVTGSHIWQQLSVGYQHTCGVTTGGAGYCWGSASSGRLGNTVTSGNYSDPQSIDGAYSWQNISAGYQSSCGVTTGNVGYCWGANNEGQLGDGSIIDSSSPKLIPGGWQEIKTNKGYSPTESFSCGISTAGAAYCWGVGTHGRLGNNNTSNSLTPSAVTGGHTFTKLSLGQIHSCGITGSGAAYCWGYGFYGQMGNGTLGAATYKNPVLVTGGHTWQDISAGYYHSCGVTTAGAAYCWGSGSDGRTGTGIFSDDAYPKPVLGGLIVTSLSNGYDSSCLTSSGNTAYCWGKNEGNYLATPLSKFLRKNILLPGSNVIEVSSSLDHTCVINESNQAYCWGLGKKGQLGNGANLDQNSAVLVSGTNTWTQIAAGREYSCALNSANQIYCWGSRSQGLLGDGSSSGFTNTPVLVSGGHSWKAVSGGSYYHNCGITVAGDAYCWGDNSKGQLGNNNMPTDSNIPVLVSGGKKWKSIVTGYFHTCGIDSNDDTYCWGRDEYDDALGDGPGLTNQAAPAKVLGSYRWKSLSAFGNSTCGVDTNDKAYCWGDGYNYKLGDGGSTDKHSPTLVNGGHSWKQISIGDNHTCGITLTNQAYCWGRTYQGQNGSETAGSFSTSPTLVPGGDTWLSIFSGLGVSFGIFE